MEEYLISISLIFVAKSTINFFEALMRNLFN